MGQALIFEEIPPIEPVFNVILTTKAQREFFKLPDTLQAKTLDLIEDLKIYGHELGEPKAKSMGKGLFELRAISPDGIARSFFFFTRGKNAYIVHIFQKKSSKTPKKNLEIAFERMKSLKQTLGRVDVSN